ncbi:sulfotransferase domain-containing protein [Sulfitobacter alexandrii]|uniref:sulfotransferase domain-containing protein n=1 Tax=Sulfitobacter alexandrii TaxID=1917485 RepID=UPI0012EBE53B|nr:sulfotransferase domain-containing protein [Sulfitobacter alexandrii]
MRYALTAVGKADSIAFHHDGFEFNSSAMAPHDFSLDARVERYRQAGPIVYLERDPRDVMVSLYHQVTGRYGHAFDFDGSISDFIRHPWFGAEPLHRFRQIWATLCARDIALKVTYEEAHRDFGGVLSRLTSHLDIALTPEELARAEEAACFDNMRKVEQSGTFPKNWLRPKNGSAKVRRGIVGGFADSLPDRDIAYLDQIFELDS